MSEERKSFVNEERYTALELAVKFWAGTNQNSTTKPASVGTVLDTANKFYNWLLN